jgi:hypothetical protein
VYAVNAVDTNSGLGDLVDTVDLTITEYQYTSQVDLQSGAAYTLALCPRSLTGGVPDDQTEDEGYWETYCVTYPFTTQADDNPNNPQLNVHTQPATLNNPNQITVGWSSNNYTDGQVIWSPPINGQTSYSFQATDQGNVPNYTGTYSLNIPSNLAGHAFSFTVQVRNQFQDATLWYKSTVIVQAATNYHSLLNFLAASNVGQLPIGVRQFMKGVNSLRSLMQI